MDFTSRMAALLGAFRRERNGAVADSMRFYGAPCGLNYGVSLPTLRTLARAEAADHDFAKYLWRQDVRCLRLAAALCNRFLPRCTSPIRRALRPGSSPSGATGFSILKSPRRPPSRC